MKCPTESIWERIYFAVEDPLGTGFEIIPVNIKDTTVPLFNNVNQEGFN